MYKIRACVMLFLLVQLTGCVDWVDDKSDLKSFVADTQATPQGTIPPLPEFKPYRSFIYEGASMREPFEALLPLVTEVDFEEESEDDAANGIKPDEAREKDYLETFALDKLTMVGTITEKVDNQLWALIRDQNSEIHRVTVGDYMGLDFGVIKSLDERKIELIEIVTNGRGGWMKRPRNLALDEQE